MLTAIEKHRPKYLIETIQKDVGGAYPQPIELCNGREYYEYPVGSYERDNWGCISWDSDRYTYALHLIRHEDKSWINEDVKGGAFEVVYEFLLNGRTYGSVTPMFPFEIHLMNRGFTMTSFSELNSMVPGGEVLGKGRIYNNGDLYVYMVFGVGNSNFCFRLSSHPREVFQVENDPDLFESAISGKLKPIQPIRRI